MAEINEILIFLVGGVIGFVICRFTLGTKQKAAQQKELESSKAELEEYKAQVTSHFNDSAKLMGEVASSYQALYKHMAGQSQTLLSDSDIETQPFPQLKTAPEKKPQDSHTAEESAPEAAPEESSAEEKQEPEEMIKNDSAQETGEEKAEQEDIKESSEALKEETGKETAQPESGEETGEKEPKKDK